MGLLEVFANNSHLIGKFQKLLELPRRRVESPRPARKWHRAHLTPDQQAEIVARYQAGEKAYRLTREFHVHRTTVAKLVADAHVHRLRSLTPDQLQEAIALYGQGWSCSRIGQHFDKNDGTIWRALKQAGVTLRDMHGRDRSDAI